MTRHGGDLEVATQRQKKAGDKTIEKQVRLFDYETSTTQNHLAYRDTFLR